MNSLRFARICQVAGLAALLCAVLIFLVLFYVGATVDTKLLPSQEARLFGEACEAWNGVAVGGACLGLAFICAGVVAKAWARKGAA